MTHEMIVIAFPRQDEAERVVKTLKQMDKQAIVDLKNAAVIERDRKGKIEFRETKDLNAKQAAMVGAAGGALLGVLRGKMLKKAVLGTVAGAAAGKFIDLGLKDDFLKDVGAQLEPGSSAVVALVDFQYVDEAMRVLDQFDGGTILRHELSAEVYQKLSAVVED
jgi:uncharacterized membrane protein